MPHTYNVRVAWALALLAHATDHEPYRVAALKNAAWARSQQEPSGWLAGNEFRKTDEAPLLHTIAYSLRGLLEIGVVTGHAEYVEAAAAGGRGLRQVWERKRFIPATSKRDWTSDVTWRCLPGEAQIAIVWLKLARLTSDSAYRAAADGLLESLKSTQFLQESDSALHGGVSGSFPINSPYERYCLVNWGPKFLIDALILRNSDDTENNDGS